MELGFFQFYEPQSPVRKLVYHSLYSGGFASARIAVKQAVCRRLALDESKCVVNDLFPLGLISGKLREPLGVGSENRLDNVVFEHKCGVFCKNAVALGKKLVKAFSVKGVEIIMSILPLGQITHVAHSCADIFRGQHGNFLKKPQFTADSVLHYGRNIVTACLSQQICVLVLGNSLDDIVGKVGAVPVKRVNELAAGLG